MNTQKSDKQLAMVPFQYEMVLNFFHAACNSLDSILNRLDGYQDITVDDSGRPLAPNYVTEKYAKLPIGEKFNLVGSCLQATTSLGLAFAHALHLLGILTSDDVSSKSKRPNQLKLIGLYNSLPQSVCNELNASYELVHSHDFEMEISAGPFPESSREDKQSGKKDFRQMLEYWDTMRMLQDSHLLFAYPRGPVVRFLIPLRSVHILDRILANQIAPRLKQKYQMLDNELSRQSEPPKLSWKDGLISVSLPNKLGHILEAQWKPAKTTVLRIREENSDEWSLGFEIPLDSCAFVDLKPDTEYEVMITQKNDFGESEPVIDKLKTKTESS
ncbi:MAG: fibronectin type III domain-containing protein [Gammaproteobacteria bacterium]|nr:fibronectin type III domain-containing protein [Gammaproteobacteria bacterium]MYK44225.1 fibronectin type III domain-containing protein [Gammaproteobacteria bacterium]